MTKKEAQKKLETAMGKKEFLEFQEESYPGEIRRMNLRIDEQVTQRDKFQSQLDAIPANLILIEKQISFCKNEFRSITVTEPKTKKLERMRKQIMKLRAELEGSNLTEEQLQLLESIQDASIEL